MKTDKTKNDLKNFYDQESKKYFYTRKKYRSDGEIILKEISKIKKNKISILEFGCGGGRLINFLNKNISSKKINYIGVDISKKLLELAKKDNPKNKFYCDDITNFIKNTKQESLDLIIGISSFQHIPTKKERLFLMKIFYKSLKYNGKIIMTNRSFSKWFIKKYLKNIIKSITKYIFSLGIHDRKNIDIPRKNGKEKKHRFYHIFDKKELKTLSKESGFKIEKLTYIDKKGQTTKNRKESKNTIFVGEKNI